MGIFTHLVPANIIGRSVPLNPVTGAFIVQDVARGVYVQLSASPLASTLVGYVPATSDGQSGLTQLARGIDAQFYSQTVTGFTASITGTTLTVNYPNVSVFWNGAVQTLVSGSFSGTVTTGTWSLVVGYNWGLTAVSLVQTSALDPTANYIELCEIVVNTTTPSTAVSTGTVGCRLMQTLCTGLGASAAYGIPVSSSTGTLPW